MPAKLQPTTSAVTIIRHSGDRPAGLKDNVVIFRELATPDKLDLLEYYVNKDVVYKSGDYNLLSSETVHNHIEDQAGDAYSCVVYVDAPILTSCNIIDAPGFANNDADRGDNSDTAKALSMLSLVDVLIYMSPVTGCMDSTDLSSLRAVFKSVPEASDNNLLPLSNIFFVASHAAPHISNESLEELKKTASIRIYKHFYMEEGDGILQERTRAGVKSITSETIESRWYFFWSNTKDRSTPLLKDLFSYLGAKLPAAVKANTKNVVAKVKDESIGYLSDVVTSAIEKLNQYEKLLISYKQELKPEELAKKIAEIESLRFELLDTVKCSHASTIKPVKLTLQETLTVEYLEDLIKSKYKDRNEAKEFAYAHIMERIQLRTEKIFIAQTKNAELEISSKLESCSTNLSKVEVDTPVAIPFDAKGAFVGAGAGAALAAGLGTYASTLGALGGYAVAAQGVGFLSSLGLGFGLTGGSAGIMSGIAAIGGPIVLTAILAGALGLGAKRLFGDSWQRRLAKQILTVVETEKIISKIIGNIDSEFTKLKNKIDGGSNNLKNAYMSHIKMMQEELSNPAETKTQLKKHIEELQEDLGFFVKAPWGQP